MEEEEEKDRSGSREYSSHERGSPFRESEREWRKSVRPRDLEQESAGRWRVRGSSTTASGVMRSITERGSCKGTSVQDNAEWTYTCDNKIKDTRSRPKIIPDRFFDDEMTNVEDILSKEDSKYITKESRSDNNGDIGKKTLLTSLEKRNEMVLKDRISEFKGVGPTHKNEEMTVEEVEPSLTLSSKQGSAQTCTSIKNGSLNGMDVLCRSLSVVIQQAVGSIFYNLKHCDFVFQKEKPS